MTREDVIKHWKTGAQQSMRHAELGLQEGTYALVLFHCSLAVEKTLKALYIQEHNDSPPATHNLHLLATKLARTWSKDEEQILKELTEFAVAARYDDPVWADTYATKDRCAVWVQRTKNLLAILLS